MTQRRRQSPRLLFLYTYELTYDAARQQYLAAGHMPGQASDSLPVMLAFSADDLKRIAIQDWPDQETPTVFLPVGAR